VSLGAGFNGGRRYALGPWAPLAVLLCALPIVLAVAVPVVALAVSAGPWGTYAKALQGSAGQIGLSLLVATGTAGAATLLGLGVAVSLRGAVGRWRTPLELLSQVPFAVPPVVLGIGLIQLWNRPATDWLYGSAAMLVLGGTAHFVPFAVRAVYANLQQIDPRLLEAGRLAGAGTWRVALRIALPLLRNGLLAGFFIVFVLSFSELGVTLLVTPPGIETIPIKIYNLMHYGAESMVAALCLILAAIQALVAAVLWGTARALGPGPRRPLGMGA
jgi:iron(III) transport system permease protein